MEPIKPKLRLQNQVRTSQQLSMRKIRDSSVGSLNSQNAMNSSNEMITFYKSGGVESHQEQTQ